MFVSGLAAWDNLVMTGLNDLVSQTHRQHGDG